eukprot:SAG31_NODE_33023_length_348_cov_60.979920_2_plen_53_part_01
MLRANRGRFGEGVVHSFDGPLTEAMELSAPELRLFIGFNGCSLKTEDNLATAS